MISQRRMIIALCCLFPTMLWSQEPAMEKEQLQQAREQVRIAREQIKKHRHEIDRQRDELMHQVEELNLGELESMQLRIESELQALQPLVDSVASIELPQALEALDDFNFAFDFDYDVVVDLDMVDVPDVPDCVDDVPDFPARPPQPPLPLGDLDRQEIEATIAVELTDQRRFDDLSDDDRTRVEAIRCLGNMTADQALPALTKILKDSTNPAFRYEAVFQLRRFIDSSESISLLIDVAKNDTNVHVRKLAIHILGNSDDDKAIQALHEIVNINHRAEPTADRNSK
jgi:HEAT repeat protein